MIQDRLDEARRRLLDLSRRNRLLNFKPGAPGVIRIVGEDPAIIYDLLCNQQKSMRFAPIEDTPVVMDDEAGGGGLLLESIPAPIAGDASVAVNNGASGGEETEQFVLPAEVVEEPQPVGTLPASSLTDTLLQTAHTGARLQTLLVNISRQAESALQEQGCNILYLTVGVLEWVDRAGARSLAPLLLIPVELQRRSVRHRYMLRAMDDEAVVNPVLREYCRVTLGVDLPEFDSSQENPIADLFEAMGRVMVPGQGWTLRADLHVALLSFAKLLMYLDLDPQRWPAESPVHHHPMVVSLCGLGSPWPSPASPVLSPTDLDDRVSPSETYQVLDADSSQEAAILAAKRGVSMVIEGPPGTGKSQTITNIIAECLAEGKTVLFVAEKAVALEVVKSRLEQVGLGSFVAELHSRKASKRAFVEELARVLSQESRSTSSPRDELNAEDLARLRANLNHYVRALHEIVHPLGISVHEAVSRCAALAWAPEAPCEFSGLTTWGRQDLQAAHEAVTAYAGAFTRAGAEDSHVWRGVNIGEVPLTTRQALPGAVEAARGALRACIAASRRLAVTCSLGEPTTIAQAEAVVKASVEMLTFPKGDAEALRDHEWDSMPEDVAGLLAKGRRLESLRETLEDRWLAEAEVVNWTAAAPVWRSLAGKRRRVFSPRWWGVRKAVRRHLQPGARPDPRRISEDLDLLTEARTIAADLRRHHERGQRLFGRLWRGDASSWGDLEKRAAAMVRLRQPAAMGLIDDEGLVSALGSMPSRAVSQPAIDAIRWAVERLRHEIRTLRDLLKLDAAFLGGALEDTAFSIVGARLDQCAEGGVPALEDWIELRRTTSLACSRGLESFLAWTRGPGLAHDPSTWPAAMLRQFHRLWLDLVVRESDSLRRFRVPDHERTIDAFRAVDAAWLTISRARLAGRIAAGRPRLGQATTAATGLGMLEAEVRRRRNIKPIRRLLASPCAPAIVRLKPCFMMSPISVAQYLEPGRLAFDVVIFDEASQIEPADAIGAVARAKQVILVGDDKQLPPTNFFASVLGESRQDESTELSMPVSDLESVLAVGQAHLPRRATLRWHYRSRHQSLIEFSNAEFYSGVLRVFPSPRPGCDEVGLRYVHVADGVYHRARGQHNPIEARRVAQAVIEHARARPGLSLGVGAFSVAQQAAIENEIERLRVDAGDPALEAFFDPSREEPFFVKNLETVQGDERDVILLSVAYGPDELGRITMNFGPLNHDGGWRRLNVLVTRARLSCVVFASIRPEQIRVDAGTPRGVRALRAYLEFARAVTGDGSASEAATAADAPPEAAARAPSGASGIEGAPLADVIAARLRGAGLDVRTRVGCAGFEVDVAVVDPATGLFDVGIETDGPVYASCPTARDRDRLRTLVLRKLGWRIVRTWSLEWLVDPDRATSRLLKAIERARQQAVQEAAVRGESSETTSHGSSATPPEPHTPVQSDGQGDSSSSNAAIDAAAPVVLPEDVVPYVRFKGEIRGDRTAMMSASPQVLASLVAEIARVEGPIHLSELTRHVCDVYQARTVGTAPAHVRQAVDEGVRQGLVRTEDDFVMPAEMSHPPIRWRDAFDAVTSAELIWRGEAAQAAVWIVRHEFGASQADLPAAVLRRMGFRRATPALIAMAEAGVAMAIEQGLLIVGAEGFVTVGAG